MKNLKQIQEFFSKPLEENTTDWPKEVPSRHGDIIFRLVKVMPDRAKYELIDAETGKTWEVGGRVYGTVNQLKASAEDTIKPQGGRQSSQFESVNEAKIYKKGDKLKIKLKNGKKFDVVFDSYSRTKGVALGKFKDRSGEYDTKPFNLDTIVESVGTIDEAKVDYDFSERELIRVLRQLKRGASTEINMIKAFTKALGRDITKDELFSEAINEYDVYMPSQEEVDKFFALTHNETHYLNSKPVMGQEGTSNLMPIEPWDEYDFSNWKALVRKAKAKGKSLDEIDESVNLKQSKLSSSEYQKAKKLKAFDAKDWEWNAGEGLYIKVINEDEAKKEDKIDIITMDVPLFIRILEYSREDAQEDMDLHELTEKAIKATKQQGILQMDDYDMLVGEEVDINEFISPNDREKSPEQAYDRDKFSKLVGKKVVYAGVPGIITHADEYMIKLKDNRGNTKKINYNMFTNQGFIKELLNKIK